MPARKSSNKNRTLVFALGKGRFFENPYLPRLGLAALITAVLFFFLNFFGILPFSNFFFGQGGTGREAGIVSSELGLLCPVEKEFCGQGTAITWNGSPALSYELPAGTKIFALADIEDYKTFSTDPFQESQYRGVWQTKSFGRDCYALTYYVPADSAIRMVPGTAPAGELIIVAKDEKIKTGGLLASLVLQIQRRELGGACKIGTLQPREFGEYLKINPDVFR